LPRDSSSVGAEAPRQESLSPAGQPIAPGLYATGPLYKYSKRLIRGNLYGLLLVADILCLFAAFALGAIVRFGNLDELTWLRMALAATPLFVVIGMHNGAYSHAALESPNRSAATAAGALVCSFALLFMISYFLKAEQDVSRLAVAVGGIAAMVSIASGRVLIGKQIRRWLSGQLTGTIVIADGTDVAPAPGTVVIDPKAADLRPDERNPRMLQRFAQLVEGADRVVVCCQREACSSWATLLKSASIRGEILAGDVESIGAVGIGRLGNSTTLVVAAGPLSIQQRALKRCFDVLLATMILVLIAPVLAAIVVAIKLDSRGPILFKQVRVGFGNKPFEVFKFRSMLAEASDALGVRSAFPGDDRVTRVGRFIRRTSLDELPQLFNVLLGSMSLVGPRPHALGSLAGQLLFWDVDVRYGHRHVLKPGITGLAQVRGHRGATHQVEDLSRRLQSDLEYIAGWSIWRDITILAQTLRVMVHPNAY
jgi:polysaccharide biosynthesis protein PslA